MAYPNNTIKNPAEITEKRKPLIMCIGVGGGGSNVVNYMHKKGIKNVTLVVSNTDAQALKQSPVPIKLQLGPLTTHGLGAGANPEVGKCAALESKEDINQLLQKHVKMLFVTAGMGGGTGTGGAPLITSIAKDKGMLVIGVVTTPFSFEGTIKKSIAEEGIQQLNEFCDTLIIIENERLMKEDNEKKGLSLSSAFELVDQVLYEAISSITNPINEPGEINLDFRDVDTMLRNAGNTVMGTGITEGEGRGMKAIQQALNSPLLRHQNIKGSTRLLLSVTSSREMALTLTELSELGEYIKKTLENDQVMVIWGHSYNEELGEKIRVSIIASGFSQEQKTTPPTPSNTSNLPFAPNDKYQYNAPKSVHTTRFHSSQEATTNEVKTLAERIELWREQITSNTLQLSGVQYDQPTEREIKELIATPAYQRKNVSLNYTPPSQEPPIRHSLSDTEGQ